MSRASRREWLIAVVLLGPLFITVPEVLQSAPSMAEVAFTMPGTVKCLDYPGIEGPGDSSPGDQFLWMARAGRGWVMLHSDLTGIGLQYSRAE